MNIKLLPLAATMIFTISCSTQRQGQKASEPLCGGYGEYHSLSDDEQELFITTYKGDIKLTPQSVSSQVVAGMNYSFICKDSVGNSYKVKIFKPLPNEGMPKVTSVTKE